MKRSSKQCFVKSENNAADTFAKNVTEYLFLKHTLSYMNHLADEKHHTYIMIEEEEEVVTEYLFLKDTSSYMNHLADEKHHTYIMIEEEEEDEVDDHPIVF
jgi:hypothetical protein